MNKKVKQRLVGAAVLSAFAALLIPMIFQKSNIKSKDIIMTPLAQSAPQKPDISAVVAKQRIELAQQQQSLQKEIYNSHSISKGFKAQMVPSEKIWLLQLASFKKKTDAKNFATSLVKLNIYPHITKTNLDAWGTIYRVVLGPYKSRKMANRAQSQTFSTAKLKGLVVLAHK